MFVSTLMVSSNNLRLGLLFYNLPGVSLTQTSENEIQ